MGSLYRNMQSGGASYGVVPGNGNPRADDKSMNVGPGHVVPAQNTHLAKKVVKKLGYDPNVKVDMNQGNGMGADIKISSKEYFLNDEQVSRMKNELGLDPEILSPNSDYNQRVQGGSTQEASDMIQQKLKSGGGIYGMMNKNQLQINNNNQYPSYQDAGSTNQFQPYERPDLSSYPYQNTVDYGEDAGGTVNQWIDNMGRVVYTEGMGDTRVDYTGASPEDWEYFTSEGYSPEYDAEGMKGLSANPDYVSGSRVGPDGTTEFDPVTVSGKRRPGSGLMPTLPLKQLDTGITPLEERSPLGLDGRPIEGPAGGPTPDPGATNPKGTPDERLTPEEQNIKDLREKNAENARGEKLANIGMGLWNMSRSPEHLPDPTIAPMREVVRDYEGMKLQAKKDIESSTRGNMKKMRELGLTNQMVGADANTKQMTMKANSQIWDMMNRDQMYNAAADNQRQADYYNKAYKHGLLRAQHRGNFAREKGKNISDNVAQYFDVQENEFQNDAKLAGYETNQQMDRLDSEYNQLDVAAIRKSGKNFVSRDEYYKMTPEEQAHLRSLKS